MARATTPRPDRLPDTRLAALVVTCGSAVVTWVARRLTCVPLLVLAILVKDAVVRFKVVASAASDTFAVAAAAQLEQDTRSVMVSASAAIKALLVVVGVVVGVVVTTLAGATVADGVVEVDRHFEQEMVAVLVSSMVVCSGKSVALGVVLLVVGVVVLVGQGMLVVTVVTSVMVWSVVTFDAGSTVADGVVLVVQGIVDVVVVKLSVVAAGRRDADLEELVVQGSVVVVVLFFSGRRVAPVVAWI